MSGAPLRKQAFLACLQSMLVVFVRWSDALLSWRRQGYFFAPVWSVVEPLVGFKGLLRADAIDSTNLLFFC